MVAKKPPQKRRKLTSASSPLISIADIDPNTRALAPKQVYPVDGRSTNTSANTQQVCTSCHRALNVAYAFLIFCARCASPTCTICSRTCTSSAPSQPPTPHLTWSPTPSPSPIHSPRRIALALNSPNTNLNMIGPFMAGVNVHPRMPPMPVAQGNFIPGKRRKMRDEDEDGDGGKMSSKDPEKGTESEKGREGEADGYGPGCGRTICRNCCFENMQSNSTTCYDCYGR